MDSISLIIAALGAGAIAASKDIAGTAVKDAYQGLKTLIKGKFENTPNAQVVLEEHEKDPDTYEAPLKKKLSEAGADRDEKIIEAAQNLLKQTKPQELQPGKYNVVFQGPIQGSQVGDHNNQENKWSS